ncbi:MAG TPA: PLP-dependent aminotransferase family protein [Candidatus Angelobacter sp.]|nr:PLP-dependent aminotransferase family protein [Candidatus Angelobacter sp.]
MADSWATSGLDLHLQVGRSGVRRSLETALRDAVQTGRLGAGTALPSSRALAADLGVARNTVAEAYGQLVAEGWLEARHGSGTWVSGHAQPAPRATAPTTPPQPWTPRYSLLPGRPNVSAFPRGPWAAAARRALAKAPSDAFDYGDPRGRVELREALAGYLSRARGLRVVPDHIVVTSGFTQALALVTAVLRARQATTLAVEAFGVPLHRRVIERNGVALRHLDVDGLGARVGMLEREAAVLLTPAHQFPLGVPLDNTRRREAIDWAQRTGAFVIEDDYDGEFRFDRQAIGAMQALAPDRVVYAGTSSKSLSPALRLGWLAVPPELLDEVAEAKALADHGSSVLDQLTLAELIVSGEYDRHVRRMRLAYRRRRERLTAALTGGALDARPIGIASGMHLLVELPPGTDEPGVIDRARGRGLAIEGLGSYSQPGAARPAALVIGYATPPDHLYTAALARLCAVLAG